jgi:hypothetical protein
VQSLVHALDKRMGRLVPVVDVNLANWSERLAWRCDAAGFEVVAEPAGRGVVLALVPRR